MINYLNTLQNNYVIIVYLFNNSYYNSRKFVSSFLQCILEDTNNAGRLEETSNEMKQVPNDIATLIWNACRQ